MILQIVRKIACATPLLLGMLGVTEYAKAAHPLVTDDPGTQGAGNNQLEFNSDRITARDGSGQTVGDATYTRGLTDTLDIFADQPMTVSAPRGIGDTSLGLKWRFFDNGATALAFKTSLSLANANDEKGFGNGRNNASTLLIASQTFKAWNIYYNLGLDTNRFKSDDTQSANRRALWKASMAATYALTPQLKAVGDIGISRNPDVTVQKNPAYALTGVIYSPSPKVDLDAGVKFGLNDALIRHQIGAGVTLHF